MDATGTSAREERESATVFVVLVVGGGLACLIGFAFLVRHFRHRSAKSEDAIPLQTQSRKAPRSKNHSPRVIPVEFVADKPDPKPSPRVLPAPAAAEPLVEEIPKARGKIWTLESPLPKERQYPPAPPLHLQQPRNPNVLLPPIRRPPGGPHPLQNPLHRPLHRPPPNLANNHKLGLPGGRVGRETTGRLARAPTIATQLPPPAVAIKRTTPLPPPAQDRVRRK